jgi:hypothetical protein
MRENAPKRDAKIRIIAKLDGPYTKIGVGSSMDSKDAIATMRAILKSKRMVYSVPENKDKVVRATPLEPIFQAGKVHVPANAPWLNDWLKKRHTHHVFDGLLSDQELESLFVEDGLVARIVKLLPDDMYREGWEYEFPEIDELKGAEYGEAYAAIFEDRAALSKMKEATYWNRLKGGDSMVWICGSRSIQRKSKHLKSSKFLTVRRLISPPFSSKMPRHSPGRSAICPMLSKCL